MEVVRDNTGLPRSPQAYALDVITVHGLFDSRKEALADDNLRPQWLPMSFGEGKGFCLRVLSYQRVIDKYIIHTRRGLKVAAQGLLDALMQQRKECPQRPIAFICQDIGGIVLKNAFILAAQNHQKYTSILDKSITLIFLGCPHRVPDRDGFADRLAVWLSRNSLATSGGIFSTATSFASSIMEINGLFADTGMIRHTLIVNVFSEHHNLLERVFSPFSLTLDVPMELKLPSPRPLATLLCGDFEKSEEAAIILKHLEALTFQGPKSLASRRFFQTSPLYPHHDEVGEHEFEWVIANPAFTKWLHGHECGFLHILNDLAAPHRFSHPGSLLNSLKGRDFPRHVFYFRFEKDDARLDNRTAMLTTFIAHAHSTISLASAADERIMEWLERNKVTSERYSKLPWKDLLLIFRETFALFRLQHVPVTLVLWNLDGCAESLPWVVDFIADISSFSEAPLRILLESSGSEALVGVLKKLKAVTIKTSSEEPMLGYQDLCRREVANLMRIDPSASLQKNWLEKAQARHRHHNAMDIPIARWICRYTQSIAAVSGPKDVTSSLERLANITTQELLMDMMATIPPHKLQWAKGVLAWLLVSFRPLTTWELEDALSFGVTLDASYNHPDTSRDFAGELQACFSGLITVSNNQVSYAHPMVRHFLTQSECEAKPWYTSPATAHFETLETLLGYFSKNQKGPLDPASTSGGVIGSRTALSRQDLRSYAADFWLRHYLEANKGRPSSSVLLRGFLNNPSAIRSWTLSLDSQALPTDPGSNIADDTDFYRETMVTLAIRQSRHGLTLRDLEELCPNWSSSLTLVQAAIREAAMTNNTELITALMPLSEKLDTEVLLVSLSVCEDPDIIRHSFNKFKGHAKFPVSFLKRAASLGVCEIIRAVTEGTASHNDDRPLSDLLGELLVDAILWREVQVVGILAEALSEKEPKLSPSAMNVACRVGESQSVDLILRAGLDMDSFEDVPLDQEPLYTACAYGNWEAAKTLVEKGALSYEDKEEKFYSENLLSSLQVAVTRGFVQCTTCVLGLVDPKDCSLFERGLLWECLMQGVKNGQLETCRVLLENGVDPNNMKTCEGKPVLCLAFDSPNKIDLMELLLKYNVPLEAKNGLGNTPLYIASNLGLEDVVGFLVAKKANVNTRAKFGGTALYQASIKNHPKVVKILLDNGADVRLSTYFRDWSPLEAAFDFPEIIRLLMPKKPDYRRASGGTTALWRAARGGYVESVELLLKGEGVEVDYCPDGYTDKGDGWTPLAVAARFGHAKVVRLLLGAGANVNHINPATGDFILRLASSEEVVTALLEYAPDLKLVDGEGNTALHIFASEKKLPLLKRLVNAKAEINALNEEGQTPLLLAISSKSFEKVEWLLSKGANANLSEAFQGEPLQYACRYANLDIIKLLVRHNADVNVSYPFIGTPLACVCLSDEKQEQLDKIKYLVEEAQARIDFSGGPHGLVLNEALLRCDLEVVNYLVRHGGKDLLHQEDGLGRTPLFYACYRRHGALETVDYLLSQGVNISPNDRDLMGRTVLHCAAVGHNVGLIRRLVGINKGLISAIDHQGWTPLHWAMRNAYRPSPGGGWNSLEVVKDDLVQTVEILLDGDSQGLGKIGYANDRAWTPIKLAKYHGVYHMIKDKLTMLPTDKADGNHHRAEYSQLYESPVAVKHQRLCDACFCQMHGIYYRCSGKTCFNDFDLCFKCIKYEGEQGFHDETHTLLKEGPEYEDAAAAAAAAAAAVEPPEIVINPATAYDQREMSLEPTSRVEEIHSWDDFIDFDDFSATQSPG